MQRPTNYDFSRIFGMVEFESITTPTLSRYFKNVSVKIEVKNNIDLFKRRAKIS